LATQWPVDEQVSSAPQSLGLWQAGMQLPVLPPTPQTHGPPGPQTIGLGGAASSMTAQSESALQGFCGIAQIPHPDGAPPGLHESVDGQSAFDLQETGPSDEPPASAGQATPSSLTVHACPSHDANALHPYVHRRPAAVHTAPVAGLALGQSAGFPPSLPCALVEPEQPIPISKLSVAPNRIPPMFASNELLRAAAATVVPRRPPRKSRGFVTAHVCRQGGEGMVTPIVSRGGSPFS
jgi:hypothetical protein